MHKKIRTNPIRRGGARERAQPLTPAGGVYLHRGYIDPGLAMPVMLGGLPGAFLGTRILVRTRTQALRIVFSIVILALAAEMIYNGAAGRV